MTKRTETLIGPLRALVGAARNDPRAYPEVFYDLGRILSSADGNDSRAASAVRELGGLLEEARLRFTAAAGIDEANELLAGGKTDADVFLAGAFWAAGDVVSAYSRRMAAETERRSARQGRQCAREGVMTLLESQATVSNHQVLDFLKGQGIEVGADTVSKAFSDLLQNQLIEEARGVGYDRRSRNYQLVDQGDTVDDKVTEASIQLKRMQEGEEPPNGVSMGADDAATISLGLGASGRRRRSPAR